jgi:hypothetical protein
MTPSAAMLKACCGMLLQVPWMPRQALHAWRLQLLHPLTQQAAIIEAPLPADMLSAAARLGLQPPK